MTYTKKLSLCSIIKNNENLEEFFQHAGRFADEIICADIGASGRSAEIAAEAGANVFHTTWNDDYSQIKNMCMDQAKGRWALFLQPDERIEEDKLERIAFLLDNPNAEAYLLYVDQGALSYRIASPVQSLRLVRNRPEYRFRYKSYEHIPDESLSDIRESGIRILQGPDPDRLSERLFLLEAQLSVLPKDNYLQYIYGIELLNEHKNTEAIRFLKSAKQSLNLDCLYAPHLYKCLSWVNIAARDYEAALEVLNEGVQHFPFYADLFVMRGDLKKQNGQYEDSLRDLENALKVKGIAPLAVPGSEVDPAVMLASLGEAHERLLNYNKALDCYLQAYERNASDHALLYKINKLAGKAGRVSEFDRLIQNAVKHKDAGCMMTISDILYQNHEYQQVLDHLVHLEGYLTKGQTESIRDSCQGLLKEKQYWDGRRPVVPENNTEAGLSWENETAVGLCPENMEFPDDPDELFDQMESLLWMNRTEQARSFLHVFLSKEEQGAYARIGDDQYIKLALLWAEKGMTDGVSELLFRVKDRKKQIELKQKTIMEFLRRDELQKARKITDLAEHLPLGSLEVVVRSRYDTDRLKKWIGFDSLKLPEAETSNVTAESHYEIGNLYEKSNRRIEAFFAYFRALQWEPLFMQAQDKVNEMLNADEKFCDLLQKKHWPLEGKYFDNQDTCIDFILAANHFNKRDFKRARSAFSKLETAGDFGLTAAAYTICSQWLDGNEADAETCLLNYSDQPDIRTMIYQIFSSSMRGLLIKKMKEYSYSEILIDEFRRVDNSFGNSKAAAGLKS